MKPKWLMRLAGGGRRRRRDPDPFDPSLVVVAASCDEAEACSAILDRCSQEEPVWVPSVPVVSRFHLLLPPHALDDAVAVAAEAGYLRAGPPGTRQAPSTADDAGEPAAETVVLVRVEVLDALHLAQERARMAGLAQRRGGRVRGWDALQEDLSGRESADRGGAGR